jgi:hypothetical protein
VTKKQDHDAAEFFKEDAKRMGIGIREYCRRFGIEYESLGGLEKKEPLTKHEHLDYRTCDVCRMNSILNGRSTEDLND